MTPLRAGGLLARRYRLINQIGVGGMSVIWRARDEVLDRLVAVKVLATALAADAKFRAMVREEARAAAQLVHQHVTSVHDYGEAVAPDGGITAFVVMELLAGEELDARLGDGPLPWAEAVEICAQVAEALAAAHRLGIVHRDVTPANIMLTATGAKVLDFGIATHVGAPDEDEEGDTFGTPAYVAPERLDGGAAQPATDIYSLGVLLFETLTGRLPYPAETWDDLTEALRKDIAPLTGVPGMPPAVADICHRCLSHDPHLRPTARHVGEVLRAQLPVDPQAATMLAPTLTLPVTAAATAAAISGGTGTGGTGHSGPGGGPGGKGPINGRQASGGTVSGGTNTGGTGAGAAGGRAEAGTPTGGADAGTPTGRAGRPAVGAAAKATGPADPEPRSAGRAGRRGHRRVGVRSPVRVLTTAAVSAIVLIAAVLLGVSLRPEPRRDVQTLPSAPGPGSTRTLAASPPVVPAAPSSPASTQPAGRAGTRKVEVSTSPAPTVRQAAANFDDLIDDGLASGAIRADVGQDLRHLVRRLRETRADVSDLTRQLQDKVTVRTSEGAITTQYADVLEDAIEQIVAVA